MNGNPQKTVRPALIAKGSEEVLIYLKNKLPPGSTLAVPTGAETSPPSPTTSRSPQATAHVQKTPQQVVPGRAAVRSKRFKGGYGYAADGLDDGDEGGASVAGTALVPTSSTSRLHQAIPSGPSCPRQETRGADHFASESTASTATIRQLEKQIAALELDLDSHSLSAAKRFALKKDVAMLRSAKIREERKLKG